jgi:hypothetical protein
MEKCPNYGGYTNHEVSKMLKEYNQLVEGNPYPRDPKVDKRLLELDGKLYDAGICP